ncbi:MAG: alpha-E domain-containing protein [Gammaproteobacteria bacterium]
MLSRVAERMYWFGRYMERVENTARLVSVNTNVLYDLPKMVSHIWDSLIDITGSDGYFYELHDKTDELNVIRFLLADQLNPASIISSLKMVRENVRTTREIMPSEVWEQVNEFHLFVKQHVKNAVRRSNRHDFLDEIIQHCHQITGLLEGGMSHGNAYNFYKIGRNIERSDMTTRIVDVGCIYLRDESKQIPETYHNILWMNVLRSLTGYQMYRQFVHDRVNGEDVVDFLMTDDEFPRSVFHCLNELYDCISDTPNHDLPLRSITRTKRIINEMNTEELFKEGLGEFIDNLQIDLAEIHNQVTETWFDYSKLIPDQQ